MCVHVCVSMYYRVYFPFHGMCIKQMTHMYICISGKVKKIVESEITAWVYFGAKNLKSMLGFFRMYICFEVFEDFLYLFPPPSAIIWLLYLLVLIILSKLHAFSLDLSLNNLDTKYKTLPNYAHMPASFGAPVDVYLGLISLWSCRVWMPFCMWAGRDAGGCCSL